MTERLRRIPADWQLDLAMVRERITPLEELGTMFADPLEHLDAKRSVDLNACHPVLRFIHDWGPDSGPYVRQINNIFVLLREANPKGLDAFTTEFVNDIEGYESKEGELFVIAYLFLKGIEIVEIYPTTGEKKSDLLVRLDGDNCFVEVFTPREKRSLFAPRVNDYLVDKLRRLRTGFEIDLNGIDQSQFSLRGGGLRILGDLPEPSQNDIDRLVRNIKLSFEKDDWEPDTERDFTMPCGRGVTIKLVQVLKGFPGTLLGFNYGSGLRPDPERLVRLMRRESRHFLSETNNIVFVNLTRGLHTYAKGDDFHSMRKTLEVRPPTKIDLIFTFTISNRPEGLLDFKKLLFSNRARRFSSKESPLKFIDTWINHDISVPNQLAKDFKP